MKQILATMLRNPQTSVAAVLYIAAKYGTQILVLWFPEAKAKLEGSANIVEGAAVAWGFLMAGDASKSVSHDQLNTAILNKTDTTKPVEVPETKP